MKAVRIPIVLVLAALAAAPAHANFGGGSKSDEPQKPPPQGISSMSYTPREEAERLYADGRDEIAKAMKELEAGKTRNAEKKFKKALDKGERAVSIDPRYHEAWNLVGYSSRKLKNYDHALVAYDKCLALKPDYTLAREYLGEAHLEMGNLPRAREQLAWLQGNAAASQDTKDLAKAVADYERSHGGTAPDSAAARPDTSRSAPADTSRSGSSW